MIEVIATAALALGVGALIGYFIGDYNGYKRGLKDEKELFLMLTAEQFEKVKDLEEGNG